MLYAEGPGGEDFPYWECRACRAELPDSEYAGLFTATFWRG